MPVTNLLKKIVDTPVYEWMRPSPISTAASNCLIGLNGQTGERYFYLIDAANVNYRYDTFSDSWQQISPVPVIPSSNAKGAVTKSQGHETIALSATSNTVQIGGFGLATKNAVGSRIRIVSGKGAGQERTITAVSDVTIHDSGFSTSQTGNIITDTTKKWRFNQWDGYTLHLLFNSTPNALNSSRRILYNSQTALTVFDTAYQMIDPLGNIAFNGASPNTAASAASLSYHIESVTLTVNSAWTDTPDSTSIMVILGGCLWFMSTAGSQVLLPQTYDVLSDTWGNRTGIATSTYYPGSALVSYPFALIDEATGAFVSGVTATSATARTLVNTGATMEYDRYANHQLRIVSGNGIGQNRRIVAHGATFMHIEKNWDIIPDSTSEYQIWADTDKIYLCGSGTSSIYQYSMDGDCWSPGQIVDYGIARSISASPVVGTGATYAGHHQPFAVTSITRVTNGIVSGSINAAGTNYVVGDLVTCSTSGANGTFFVTAVNDSGAVTALQLAACGSGYANGSSATTGGSGSGLTITLTVGNTALVATPQNHDFITGDVVGITGCATDTTFNGTFTAYVGALNSFSILAPSSSASPTAATAHSTTVVVDASKNWQTNEHTGKILLLMTTAGTAPSIESRRITSNTATSITVTTAITSPTNGTTRYVISDVHALGAAQQYRVTNKNATGWVSSATATTLVDSTKSWDNGQWTACRVRIVAGTGLGNEAAITSNTATTLTVGSWGVATPDATSKYEIMDTYGIATSGALSTINDTAKKWITNQFAGKRVKIVAGTGVGNEATITANTATQLTASGIGTPDSTSVYAIYEPIVRGVGTERFDWLFGLTNSAKKGRQILQLSGANVSMATMDIYDIPSNTWDNNILMSPSAWSLSSGSMYAYDGADSYFGIVAATGRVFQIDIPTMTVNASGITPYAQGTALLRSGMQVITTDDGLKYIYIQRHTGQDMWRTLKFW